jgi:dTDP-4-dehydrorhamnose 3,5-epimerase
MIFTELPLRGAYVIDVEPREDDRGFFARTVCREEFDAHGINADVVQAGMAHNPRRGTVRGLHSRWAPTRDSKLVRCTHGALLDVIVDLRPESQTFLQHVSIELRAETARAVYVPARFAHGYQTLRDDTTAHYAFAEVYRPEQEFGLRFDDPDLAIEWPLPITLISARDCEFAPLAAMHDELTRRMR